jgi:hypothetical protein
MAEMTYQKRSKQSTRTAVSQLPTNGSVLQDNRAASKQSTQLKHDLPAQLVKKKKPLQGKFETTHLVTEEEKLLQGKFASKSPAQLEQQAAAKPNNTGLPDHLKSGIENLSGISMDNVTVHYNSSQPAQLNALAYTQGNDIHVAPGQEQHLPHEAWHVVQQAQGRVKPTVQMKEAVPVNDEKGLETEADVIGAKIRDGGSHNVMLAQFAAKSEGDRAGLNFLTSHSAVQLATKIKHKAGTVPFSGQRFIVGKEMEATLDPNNPVTGSATTAGNYEWMRNMRAVYPGSGVIRGHLLNHDLGGYGVPENLYPISSIANSTHSDKVEQKVKKNLSESHKSTKKEIDYKVIVNEAGPLNQPYEKAEFQCSWTDKDGNNYSENIPSNLQTDSGWGGHSGKEQSPQKWRHKDRRGEEDFSTLTQPLGKIELDKTDATNELLQVGETYNTGRTRTVKDVATDAQMVEDAVDIMSEQLDALASTLEKPELNVIWDDGVKYFLLFRQEYWNAFSKKDFSNFTQNKWLEINVMLKRITAERLFIEHGID